MTMVRDHQDLGLKQRWEVREVEEVEEMEEGMRTVSENLEARGWPCLHIFPMWVKCKS